MASGNSYNVLGVVTGVLGVFGLVPASYMLAKSQLPMAKAKDLEILLSETTELLRSVAEEGLLSSPEFIDGTRRTLARIQSRSNELRLSAYSATSTVQQAKGLFCGLSYALHRLGNEVKQVRAMISNRCNHVEHRRRGVFEASLPLTPITESSSGADEHAVYDRADNRAVDDDRISAIEESRGDSELSIGVVTLPYLVRSPSSTVHGVPEHHNLPRMDSLLANTDKTASTGELDSEIAPRQLRTVSARSRHVCTITIPQRMFITYAFYHPTNAMHRFPHAFYPPYFHHLVLSPSLVLSTPRIFHPAVLCLHCITSN